MSITLTLTDVDDNLVLALKKRADARGHTIEEEHRQILNETLIILPRLPLADVLRNMPNVGNDSDFDRHASPE